MLERVPDAQPSSTAFPTTQSSASTSMLRHASAICIPALQRTGELSSHCITFQWLKSMPLMLPVQLLHPGADGEGAIDFPVE